MEQPKTPEARTPEKKTKPGKSPLILVSMKRARANKLKCTACGRKRHKLRQNDGWLYHTRAALCPVCRSKAVTDLDRKKMEACVIAIGEAFREKTADELKTKDYEVFDCQVCGAPAGSFCKQDCPSQIENDPTAPREVIGGGQTYNSPRSR